VGLWRYKRSVGDAIPTHSTKRTSRNVPTGASTAACYAIHEAMSSHVPLEQNMPEISLTSAKSLEDQPGRRLKLCRELLRQTSPTHLHNQAANPKNGLQVVQPQYVTPCLSGLLPSRESAHVLSLCLLRGRLQSLGFWHATG
jgi:hypothetical protein